MKKGEINLGSFKEGRVPWNKGIKTRVKHNKQFKKGHNPWNKGKKIEGWGSWIKYPKSEETKRKFSETKKRLYKEGKIKLSGIALKSHLGLVKNHPMLGKHHSEEARKKISLFNKNKIRKPCSEETKVKISLANKGRKNSEEAKRRMSLSGMGKHNGNKNANWKGGISRGQDMIRNMNEYKKWRSKIFERDNWTCQTCGKRGCYLEPHHIKRLIDIIIKYNIKTTDDALLCKELWDIDNGVTLCLDCHKLTRKRKKDVME